MGGRWQIAAASDWAGFSMGRGGAAAKMDGTIYAHMPRCCTSAHEEPTIPTILHRQPSPPLVLMCHRTLLRPAAVLDVPVRDQAAPHCEAIARVNWGTRAAGTDADVPEPQRIPAQGPAHRRRHVVPCESLGAIVLEQHWGIAKSGYALRVRWEPTHHDHAAHCCPYGPRWHGHAAIAPQTGCPVPDKPIQGSE